MRLSFTDRASRAAALRFHTALRDQRSKAVKPDSFLHTVGNFQYWLDRLGLKIPRALCGVSLAGNPNDPEPTVPCPVCAAR